MPGDGEAKRAAAGDARPFAFSSCSTQRCASSPPHWRRFGRSRRTVTATSFGEGLLRSGPLRRKSLSVAKKVLLLRARAHREACPRHACPAPQSPPLSTCAIPSRAGPSCLQAWQSPPRGSGAGQVLSSWGIPTDPILTRRRSILLIISVNDIDMAMVTINRSSRCPMTISRTMSCA